MADKLSLLGCRIATLLILLLFPFSTQAQELLRPLLVFPQPQLTAGERMTFFAYVHNESSALLSYDPPVSLPLELTDRNGSTYLVTARALDGTSTINLAPGQFHRREYQVTLPVALEEQIQVRFDASDKATYLIQVRPAPRLQVVAQRDHKTDMSYPSLNDLESLYQSYVAELFTYEPIYFLVGSDPSKSTFQLSFKYRILNRNGSLSHRYPWLSGLFFAYTQTSFWDLQADSIPFRDTSYKPEIMFETENLSRTETMPGLFIRSGLIHESNGRDGNSSRSTNYVYIKPMGIFYHQASRLGLMISPTLVFYVNNDNDTNRDLPDYRGHVGLETRVGKAHSLMLTTNLRFARKGTSVQTDLTYPIDRFLGNNLNVYLHLQYSNSLAESLIDYRQRTEAFRIGLSFFR